VLSAWLLGLAVTACTSDNGLAGGGLTVDSVLPREEALRRFRAGLGETRQLVGGAASPANLGRAWVAALSAADTVTLRQLVLSRAEFAWIFYPTTPQGLPPYDMSPDLMWTVLSRQTENGIAYELRHLAGKPLRFTGLDCGDSASVEGRNQVWGPCIMTVTMGQRDTMRARLTGPVVERDGQFKFVSYTNDLD
jgi:hypothetical protein